MHHQGCTLCRWHRLCHFCSPKMTFFYWIQLHCFTVVTDKVHVKFWKQAGLMAIGEFSGPRTDHLQWMCHMSCGDQSGHWSLTVLLILWWRHTLTVWHHQVPPQRTGDCWVLVSLLYWQINSGCSGNSIATSICKAYVMWKMQVLFKSHAECIIHVCMVMCSTEGLQVNFHPCLLLSPVKFDPGKYVPVD